MDEMSEIDQLTTAYIAADVAGEDDEMRDMREEARRRGFTDEEWTESYERCRVTRCWVTVRVAVDVYDEKPSDETVRDATVATVEQMGLDTGHIHWGVEGESQEPLIPSWHELRAQDVPSLRRALGHLARAIYANGVSSEDLSQWAARGAHGLDWRGDTSDELADR